MHGRLLLGRSPGFTLIELIAVLVIIGLIAGVAGLSLRAPYTEARLEHVVAQIEQLDATARSRAARTGRPQQLVIDRRAGRFRLLDPDRAGVGESVVQLPDFLDIERMASSAVDAGAGPRSIDYTPAGASPTYAVALRGPGKRETILVVAGWTGQVTRASTWRTVEQLLAQLDANGNDAD
jgi:type II secretion system protein H